MKYRYALLALLFLCCKPNPQSQEPTETEIQTAVDNLLREMSLSEKIGQMSQYSQPTIASGPERNPQKSDMYHDMIREGKIGSFLWTWTSEITRELQEIAVNESRLGIPLLFAVDIIHGYKTIFPIPLGEAASWDLDAIEQSARIAAIEATAAGIHWTFAPMVDIARDSRWGRIAEGAGEDPYLGSEIARARVKGFQGHSLYEKNTMLACAKHMAAYGAAEGGRDYNTTDMSDRVLREIYLPPFKAAIDAGVATIMSAFNELNGIPATGNRYLLTEILRQEWGFDGLVVSDWTSINEMVIHGAAVDDAEAAELAMLAGVDMDMMGDLYQSHLHHLVQSGRISETQIDQSVRHILTLKHKLGLFKDPFRYCDAEREQHLVFHPDHLLAARDIAAKSIVLLKNRNRILPLEPRMAKIAVIGPLADNHKELNGTWAATGKADRSVTLLEGITSTVSKETEVLYEKGCDILSDDRSGIDRAVQLAQQADAIVLNVGESADMSGEAKSRADLDLPGVQLDLVKALAATQKPLVVVLTNGRALAIPEVDELADAILETWFLGTQTGHAISDVLFGKVNPSGKLPVTFPRHVGQIPLYYNHKNTGRPDLGNGDYTSKYLDIDNEPLYPFGFGLSYTTFEYADLKLDKQTLPMKDTLNITVKIRNSGNRKGRETVQLYIRDVAARAIGRPVKELKRFAQIDLAPGEEKIVGFSLNAKDFSFYRHDNRFAPEPGLIKIMVGGNSKNVLETTCTLLSGV
jgi:beta-glucosidase